MNVCESESPFDPPNRSAYVLKARSKLHTLVLARGELKGQLVIRTSQLQLGLSPCDRKAGVW
jgi:hypothetical protein